MDVTIQPVPLDRKARQRVALIFIGLAGMVAVAIAAYLRMPTDIPVHFGLGGEPTRYGSKTTLFLMPAAFSIAPVIFLVLTRYRFTLIRRYPYLVNLPAFFVEIEKIREDRRGWWINRYFELLLGVGVALTYLLLALEAAILYGTTKGRLPGWFLPVVLTTPLWLIVPFLVHLKRLERHMRAEIKGEDPGIGET